MRKWEYPTMNLPESASLPWRKSSACKDSANCVELADLADGRVALRHSEDPDGAALLFSAQEWSAFVTGVRAGEFGGDA
jgi:hypothetical protein